MSRIHGNSSSPPKSSATALANYSKTEKPLHTQKYVDGAPISSSSSSVAISIQITPNKGRQQQQQQWTGKGGSESSLFRFVVFGGFLLFAISRTFVSMIRTEKEFTRINSLYDQAADNMPRRRDKKLYLANSNQKNMPIATKRNIGNMKTVTASLSSRDMEGEGLIVGEQNPVGGQTILVDDKSMVNSPVTSNSSATLAVVTTDTTNLPPILNEQEKIAKKVEGMIKKKNMNKNKNKRGAAPAVTTSTLLPVVFRWEHGGNSVNISGNFLDDWSDQIPMKRIVENSSTVFICTYNLTQGQQYMYKFNVDEIWRIAPDQPTVTDEFGGVNNLLDLRNEQIKAAEDTPILLKNKIDAGNATHQPTIIYPNGTTKIVKYPHIREFERQEGVVIVTKLHGTHQIGLLRQSLCLLTQAYNYKMKYDIVAFTTMPIDDTLLIPIREVVKPAKITVVIDNAGTLQKQVARLSKEKQTVFFDRCGVSNADNMTWWAMCDEKRVGFNRIAYAWQAEFRTLHIWKHPILAQYKYMMWLDTDGFATKAWDRDPIAIAMQNDLAIFFANWPQGRARGKEAQDRIIKSFGEGLCRVKLKEGRLLGISGKNCPKLDIKVVHGFFHITNLDFYRNPKVQNFFQELIGDCFCCRRFDDQLAVTVPAAILAAEKSWDMYMHGIKLEMFHNYDLDGKKRRRVGGFIKYWGNISQTKFPEAYGKCEITEGG